jgi:hypothetical protein
MIDSTEVRPETPPHLNVNLPETSHCDPLKYVIVPKEEWDGLQAKLEYYQEFLEHQHEERKKKKRGFWGWFLQRPVAVLIAVVMVGTLAAGAWGGSGILDKNWAEKLLNMRWFESGNSYLAAPDLYKVGYIAGASDAYRVGITAHDSNLESFVETIRPMTLGQIKDIAEKYMKDNPQHRHHSMAGLILGAINTLPYK